MLHILRARVCALFIGLQAMPFSSTYAASKAGVIGFTRSTQVRESFCFVLYQIIIYWFTVCYMIMYCDVAGDSMV